MNQETAKLRDLLSKSVPTDLIGSCLAALDRGPTKIESTEVPLENAQKIYQRRAKINEEQGLPICGFEQLLPNLLADVEPFVVVNVIETAIEWFLVFTNPAVSRLIGILYSPKP